jgi:DNA-binding transcriptional MerR regulator
MEDYKTVREISEIIDLPKSTVYYLIKKWNIKSKKKGLKRRLYDFNQLQSLLNQYYEIE